MSQADTVTVKVFDPVGRKSAAFFQGMANRLGFGAQRYGNAESRERLSVESHEDKALAAIIRIRAALQINNRELMIDAANLVLLAYHAMPECEPLDGHSPGAVRQGKVWGARGDWAHTNGADAHTLASGGGTDGRLPDSFILLQEVANRLRSAQQSVAMARTK